jgi:hypothetical protein
MYQNCALFGERTVLTAYPQRVGQHEQMRLLVGFYSDLKQSPKQRVHSPLKSPGLDRINGIHPIKTSVVFHRAAVLDAAKVLEIVVSVHETFEG